MPRKEIAKASLERNGRIILTENLMQAMELANYSAPEHMEILTENPFSLLPYVRHAGAVFLGAYSPEPLGDYFAGPNHVLPTGGTARLLFCIEYRNIYETYKYNFIYTKSFARGKF